MGIVKKTKSLLKYGSVGYFVYKTIRDVDLLRQNWGSDRQVIRRKYKKVFGRYPDLDNPQTMNEKIQWIKLNVRIPEKTILSDKYLMRNRLVERFGDEVKCHLVPMLFSTDNWRDVTLENLPDEPFIIKSNHSSQQNKIFRNKSEIDIVELRQECRLWLNTNYYYQSQEWQYKDINRRIVVEKLLQTASGRIPNDYKLHYFNGKLKFVYCSIGRETENSRNIYDADWNPLYFSWNLPYKVKRSCRGAEIPPPLSFELMKKYGEQIAQDYDYVRVDFYDVDGQMFFGEVTFHHGGGYDLFDPEEYDIKYGNMLSLVQGRDKNIEKVTLL